MVLLREKGTKLRVLSELKDFLYEKNDEKNSVNFNYFPIKNLNDSRSLEIKELTFVPVNYIKIIS